MFWHDGPSNGYGDLVAKIFKKFCVADLEQ